MRIILAHQSWATSIGNIIAIRSMARRASLWAARYFDVAQSNHLTSVSFGVRIATDSIRVTARSLGPGRQRTDQKQATFAGVSEETPEWRRYQRIRHALQATARKRQKM